MGICGMLSTTMYSVGHITYHLIEDGADFRIHFGGVISVDGISTLLAITISYQRLTIRGLFWGFQGCHHVHTIEVLASTRCIGVSRSMYVGSMIRNVGLYPFLITSLYGDMEEGRVTLSTLNFK